MRLTPESPRPPLGAGSAPVSAPGGANVYGALPETTDELQIRDYVRILYARRGLIAGTIVLGLLVGFVLNARSPRIFEAGATLQIEADPNVLALDRPLVDQRDWMREFLPTELGILASRDLARKAHEDLERGQLAAGTPGSRFPVPSVDQIVKGRGVSAVKDTRLVVVSFRSTDPATAAAVANALGQAYVERSITSRSQTTGEASEWLSQQVAEQRKLVQASEAALQRYREVHGADALFTNGLGGESQNIVVQRLGELQAAVTKARGETIEKEAQYRQLKSIEADNEPLDTLPAIASNAFLQGLKGELTTLQRQLGQASKELGDRHPDIIKLQAAVQNADRKLQTETSNVARAIVNDFEAAQARERALVSALERQKGAVQALNAKSVEYTALEREATSNREGLDKLLQRSREASLARELRSTNVRIVDTAEVPVWPILPRKNRTLMLALVGSGTLALALVFVLEIFNTRVKSPEDVRRHLRIPVLGLTPQVSSQEGQVSQLPGTGAPPRFTELLDGLRTNLVMSPGLESAPALLVTSSEPGEGKTLIAAHLAASLARLNQRVLLIDSDLRKPQLHALFGEEQRPGLAEVLAGKVTNAALRKTKVTGLWLMPAGHSTRNPADLLGSPRFSRLLDLVRRRFDWVILDSPPVLAVTDPCQMASVASGVLFVVGSGQTAREVASAAVERLDAAGAHLLGAVLNRATLDEPGQSYLPYYHRPYPAYSSQEEVTSWALEEPDALAPDALSQEDAAGAEAPAGRA